MMAKFNLGQLVATYEIIKRIKEDTSFNMFVAVSLQRYKACDWGSLCDEDKAQNDYAVKHGERIMGQYECSGQPKIWIITEWDRSVTTILFPDKY